MKCWKCQQELLTGDVDPRGICNSCINKDWVPVTPEPLGPPPRNNTDELRKTCPTCGGCGTLPVTHTK